MTEQPRQEFDVRYPVRTQPDGGPCWCYAPGIDPHEGWVHSPLCSELFRWWWRGDGAVDHPGEPHTFGPAQCIRCRKNGVLHVSLITPDEVVRIEPLPDPRLCRCGHHHVSGPDGEDAGCPACTDDHDWAPVGGPPTKVRHAAEQVLDRPNADPDDDAAILARYALR